MIYLIFIRILKYDIYILDILYQKDYIFIFVDSFEFLSSIIPCSCIFWVFVVLTIFISTNRLYLHYYDFLLLIHIFSSISPIRISHFILNPYRTLPHAIYDI